MTRPDTKASWPTERGEAAEIIDETHEQQKQWDDREQRERGASDSTARRQKIGEEKLVQRERERFEVELTETTFATSGAYAQDVGVMRSLETTSIGQAEIALVTIVIVVEAFGVRMAVVTDAQIDVVEETKEISVFHAQRVIFDDGRC